MKNLYVKSTKVIPFVLYFVVLATLGGWIWHLECKINASLKQLNERHACRYETKTQASEPTLELAPTTAYDVPSPPHFHLNPNPGFHGGVDIVPVSDTAACERFGGDYVWSNGVPRCKCSKAKRPIAPTPDAL
jgi:hypothetical protein